MTTARRLLIGTGGRSFGPPSGSISVGAISTITDDAKYNAWPTICRIATGALLVAYTKGDSHHADNTGKAVGRLSSDEAATWGAEFTIYDHPSLWVSAFGIAHAATTGRLLLTLWRDNYSVAATGEAGIVYSDDNGGTWSSWIALSSGFTQEAYGAGPACELPDGELLVTLEGSDTGQDILNRSSHLLRSTNGGVSWGSETTIRDYVDDTRPYYESKITRLPNGNLLCLHRTSSGTGSMYSSVSTDDGASWSVPQLAFAGYAAASEAWVFPGLLLAGTRRNADAACICYASVDYGDTWGTATVVDDSMEAMQYASAVSLLDGRTLLVYGSQPTASTTNSDIKQVYLTIG